jgi:two-component system, chemotaxis family, chemotaxis protein CheY
MISSEEYAMVRKDDILTSINRKRPDGLDPSGKPFKVLVVDDSTTMRKIISQQLKSEAYDVCGEASDGKEALERYKELAPDVVTMDINMPVMDGLDSLKSILAYDAKARVVMLTSEGQKDIVMNALSAGAKGYVVKPPNKAALCERVKSALGA